MEATNGIKVWQWIVTVIVIAILVFLGYKMFSGSPKTNTDVVVENTDTSTTDNSTDSNRVVVLDQSPAIPLLSPLMTTNPGFAN
jgi:uncharacterized protein YacL